MRLEATPVGSLLRKNALHQMGQNSRRDCGNQDMVARRALGGGPSAAVEPPNGSSGAEGMFVSTQVRASAVCSVAGVVLRAIMRATTLSAFVGRTLTGIVA